MEIPKTIPSLEALRILFPDKAACFEVLKSLRYEDEFVCCPDAKSYWLKKSGAWLCSQCGLKTPVTRGTIFDGSAGRIQTWFEAIWHLTFEPYGCSASELHQRLRLPTGSQLGYGTVYEWRRRISGLMVEQGTLKQEVTLEVALIPPRSRKRRPQRLVLIALRPRYYERGKSAVWLLRVARLDDTSPAGVQLAVRSMISLGSEVLTNDWTGFKGLGDAGYKHKVEDRRQHPGNLISRQGERAARELDVWFSGQFHGAILELDRYLKEFAYRYNQPSQSGVRFKSILEKTVQSAELAEQKRQLPASEVRE